MRRCLALKDDLNRRRLFVEAASSNEHFALVFPFLSVISCCHRSLSRQEIQAHTFCCHDSLYS